MCRCYEDLEEAIDSGDVRSEGGRLPISYEQAFSLRHRYRRCFMLIRILCAYGCMIDVLVAKHCSLLDTTAANIAHAFDPVRIRLMNDT